MLERNNIKLGDKVKIIKGISKSDDIYVATSIPFMVCGTKVVHIRNIKTGRIKVAYDVSLLKKVDD